MTRPYDYEHHGLLPNISLYVFQLCWRGYKFKPLLLLRSPLAAASTCWPMLCPELPRCTHVIAIVHVINV